MTLLVSWIFSKRSLSSEKEALLAQQRAAVQTVGAEWNPLRDRIERLTLDVANRPYAGDLVEPRAASWDLRSVPGLYLRLRVEDAKDVEALRKNARESVKDAFTSCLLHESNAKTDPKASEDPDAGVVPEQPWNLRQAYAATRVLTDEWANEVRDADSELRLRVFEQQYDKAKTSGIPLAIDIVKRAQFYLLVLDEDVPEAKEFADDAGVVTSEALQQVPHPARVVVVDLKSGDEIVRLRRVGEATFRFAGEQAIRDPEVRAAMRRQVNNCALADQVRAAIQPAAPTTPPASAPTPATP